MLCVQQNLKVCHLLACLYAQSLKGRAKQSDDDFLNTTHKKKEEHQGSSLSTQMKYKKTIEKSSCSVE